MDFIAFDLETTGTVAGVDAIVEIGAVKFSGKTPMATFSTLVDPKKHIPEDATRVNGITDDMVEGKPLIQDLLKPFAEFCEDLPIVAHNAPFDAQFLTADIKRHEMAAPQGVILDTLPIARKVFPGLANYKLGTLVQHLNIPAGQFHRAEEDASYCGYLFFEILTKVASDANPPIENLIALTGKPEARFPQVEVSHKQLDLLDGLF